MDLYSKLTCTWEKLDSSLSASVVWYHNNMHPMTCFNAPLCVYKVRWFKNEQEARLPEEEAAHPQLLPWEMNSHKQLSMRSTFKRPWAFLTEAKFHLHLNLRSSGRSTILEQRNQMWVVSTSPTQQLQLNAKLNDARDRLHCTCFIYWNTIKSATNTISKSCS